MNSIDDLAVAHGMTTAQCFNYSGAPAGVNSGTLHEGTGDFPMIGTREQQSAWMVATFGSGFGFPIGGTPDAVNDNRGPARQHGIPDFSDAVYQAAGFAPGFQLSARDKAILPYLPAVYDLLVGLMTAASGAAPAQAPPSAAPALHAFVSSLNVGLANLAASLPK